MPLVFVHGVNTRRGQTDAEHQVFDNRMAFLREQFNVAFRERVSAPGNLSVFTPYWGDLGVTFARNLACLPQSGIQELAVAQPEEAPLMEAMAASLDAETLRHPDVAVAPLLTLAKTRTLKAAVDLLFAGAANAPLPGMLLDETELKETLPDAARFADAAEQYATAEPQPLWLADIRDDDTFLARLISNVEASTSAGAAAALPRVQELSVGSTLKSWLGNAAAAVRNAAGTVVSATTGAMAKAATQDARTAFLLVSGFARPAASAFIGRFIGDAFTYMENRQPIIDRVLPDVNRAVAAKRSDDNEVYLVGHSFGGIVLYDIMTQFYPTIECDLYVTVGSQVALFAEIGRLADKDKIIAAFKAGPLVPRPPAAKRWLNIFDSTDLVGFGTRGVFAGAHDYRFETDALPMVSHGAYFDTPRFFNRLRERVRVAFQKGGTDTQ